MRKLFSLFAALTLSVGLWAQSVGDAFEDATSGLKFQVTAVGAANTVRVIKNNYTGTSYTIPATVSYNDVTFAVTEIYMGAFDKCSSLESITIPAGVTTIGNSAFYICSSLQSVTLPAAVTTIGVEAFFGCESLQSATLSESLTTIGRAAFSGCKSLQSVTLPEGLLTIEGGAFYNCVAVQSVTFLGNACQDAIGDMAFNGVGSIATPATLVLPNNWTGSKPVDSGKKWYGGYFKVSAPAPVEGDKFEDADSKLKFKVSAVGEANTVMVIANNYTGTSYTVPATVSYQSVTFNVTEIGKDAFEECSSLESVTIPASVTTIGQDAFHNCESLQSVTLSEGLLTIGKQAFGGCESLLSITIPASVTTIGVYAFLGCESLQSVTLPEGLLTIGEGAFNECYSLASITIPAGVTEIGMGAFCDCTGLTSVTFLGNACQDAIGEMAFYGVGADAPALLTLHGTWAKENQPDEEGNWYGGKFELSEDPTALPTLFGDDVKANKSLHNGQLIIRKGDKHFNALGAEVK